MKKDEKPVDLLICAKVANSPRPVYGSVRANCLECASFVWVSLSGQKAMRENENLKPICMECAAVRMENSDEQVKAKIVPGAIEELKRYLMKTDEN